MPIPSALVDSTVAQPNKNRTARRAGGWPCMSTPGLLAAARIALCVPLFFLLVLLSSSFVDLWFSAAAVLVEAVDTLKLSRKGLPRSKEGEEGNSMAEAQRLPEAILTASGSLRRRLMLMTPNTGPMARTLNTQRQDIDSCSIGMI